jgi:hypothetical protein
MKTKLFRRFLGKLGMTVLLMLCVPTLLQAQSGVTVGELSITPGSPSSVTFEVSWNRADVPEGKAWVFVDYNNAGTMTRLLINDIAVTGDGTVQTINGNDKGAWVVNSGDVANFWTQVTISFRSQTIAAGACAYAINYPPVGEYVGHGQIQFTGTPPFELTFDEGGDVVPRETPPHTYVYSIPPGRKLTAFTDMSGVPGTFNCNPPEPPSIDFVGPNCGSRTFYAQPGAGGTGVRWTDDEYAPATRTVTVSGTYYAVTTSDAGCESGQASVAVTINAIPGVPTSPVHATRCGTGTVTLRATAPANCTLDWYTASSGGTKPYTSVTSITPTVSQTTSYYAESRNTSTTCVNTQRLAVTATVTASGGDIGSAATCQYNAGKIGD